MQVLELKGYKSLKALNAFHTLMLGLKMLPAYQTLQYEEFYASIDSMEPADQEKMIREAVLFVELQKEEVESLICFCADANGVPYGPENMKKLGPKDLVEMIVAVSKEIAKIKIEFVSESEKKKLNNFSVDPRKTFAKNPTASLEEILNLSFYEALNV